MATAVDAQQRLYLATRVSPIIWFLHAWRRWPVFSGLILGLLIFGAVAYPVVLPHDPTKSDIRLRNTPPIGFEGGMWSHPLGTDPLGKDMLALLLAGGRVSLMVVAISIVTGKSIGLTIGLVSGYYGGMLDEVLMRVLDVWYGIPFLMVAMIVVVVMGQGVNTMIGVLAMSSFAGVVRVVRAEVLSLKERDYVALAKVVGASNPRIIIRHILPGVYSTLLVVLTLQTGGLILAEAFLSFIGAGIPPPTPCVGAHGGRRQSLHADVLVDSHLPRRIHPADGDGAQLPRRLDAGQVRSAT